MKQDRRKFIKTIGGTPVSMALAALAFQTPSLAKSAGCAPPTATTPAVQDTDCNTGLLHATDHDCKAATGAVAASSDANCNFNTTIFGDNQGDGDCSPPTAATPAETDNSCTVRQTTCPTFSDADINHNDGDCAPPTLTGETLTGGNQDNDCGTIATNAVGADTYHSDNDCTTLPASVNATNPAVGQDGDCNIESPSTIFGGSKLKDNDCWAPAGTAPGTFSNDSDDSDDD